jgi:hypothetical protein
MNYPMSKTLQTVIHANNDADLKETHHTSPKSNHIYIYI